MKKCGGFLYVVFVIFLLAGCRSNSNEMINHTGESNSTETLSEQDVNYLNNLAYTWWKDKLYISPETNDVLYASIKNDSIIFSSFNTSFIVKTNSPEYGEDDNGQFIRYAQETNLSNGYKEFNQLMSLLYYPEIDRVVTFGIGDGGDYGDYYEYYKERLPSSVKTPDCVAPSENRESTPNFYDGARYQCFETLSGSDIILTIRTFTDENTKEYFYKAELSNGMEFWFYEVNQDGGEYEIEVAGECAGRLTHTPNSSELNLYTEGYAYLNDYDGTYVQIPDEEQVESELGELKK
ncbi:MAG: hypothetical protein RR743_03405 [Oscillospiraceae bacterium]